MGYIMRFASALTNNNYLLAILLFALVIEILMIPLQIKQQKNSIAQARLQPKVRAITKKYDGRKDQASMQKKQQEIMDLYQKENFSPYSGCLPLLIQLPIVWALYRVIISPLRYICGVSKDGVAKLVELMKGDASMISEIDMIKRLHAEGISAYVSEVPELEGIALPNFNVFGLDFSATPAFKEFNWLWIIPVAVFLGMFFSTKIMRKFTYQAPETADAQNAASMKIMNTVMPLMSAWIAFSVPAAVGSYWFIRNIISVVERIIISKAMPIPKMSEEEFKAAEREYGVKKKAKRDESKPRPRSLHTIDFDDEPLPPAVPDKEDDEADKAPKSSSKAEAGPIDMAPLKDEENK